VWPLTREEDLRRRLQRRSALFVSGLLLLFLGLVVGVLDLLRILGGVSPWVLLAPAGMGAIGGLLLRAGRRTPTEPRDTLPTWDELDPDDPRQRLSLAERRSRYLRAGAMLPAGWALGLFAWLGPVDLDPLRGVVFLACTLGAVWGSSRRMRRETGSLSWPDR
jgi:hypothetical protein